MEYPLRLSFKHFAVSPQVSVTDAAGEVWFHVRQKAFALKEAVTVYADLEQTRPVATISADRVLDISATYHFADPAGQRFGALRRLGLRSWWKAHYEVLDGRAGSPVATIREENGLVKLLDGMLMQIPGLALISGYVFHPRYSVTRPDGTVLLRLRKEPAFLEGRFSIEKVGEPEREEEALVLLGLLMMVLLERRRG